MSFLGELLSFLMFVIQYYKNWKLLEEAKASVQSQQIEVNAKATAEAEALTADVLRSDLGGLRERMRNYQRPS